MGMTLPGGKRSGTRRHRYEPMSQINVTPFVDVMLVLLVVFMIAAPLLSVGVPVELPRAVAPTLQGLDEPLAITLDKEGRIYLQEKEVPLGELVPKLIAITGTSQDRRIFVRGDRSINYGRVMEVMGTINAAGFTRVALVAQAPARVDAQ
ncbi:MAG: biopolymer transporter ExbD [Pseudomonadota bacterium]|nr:biopolymer transporter ExbD [Pseudomonadota bacterium]